MRLLRAHRGTSGAAAPSELQPAWIEIAAAEAGLWLESLARDAFLRAATGPAESLLDEEAPAWWRAMAEPVAALRPGAGTERGPLPEGSSLGKALSILRLTSRLGNAELARVTGVRPRTIGLYERGKLRPSSGMLRRLVQAMGLPFDSLERALSFVEAAGEARRQILAEGRKSLRSCAAGLAAEEARACEEVVRDRLLRLAAAVRLLESRRQAPARWERLEAAPEDIQRALVAESAELQTSGFCELLCEKSVEAAGDCARRALHLADLAVLASGRLEGKPGDPAWAARLHGYSGFHRANALRVGGDLPSAERAFGHARELWLSGASADPGLLNEARVLEIEASLRRDQRRLPEALSLLDRALASDRSGETSSLMIGKAKALEELGDFAGSITLLRQAGSRLDGRREPRNLWGVRLNLAFNLCHLDRHAEAALLLPEVRTLALRLQSHLDLLRVDWLAAKVAAGLGRAEEAIMLFERVRAEFARDGLAYDAALATLELAEICLVHGRRAEVRALVGQSVAIFQEQQVPVEARRALDLFRQAVDEESVSLELARRLVAYLYRARHDPQLRFERAV